MTDYPHYGGLPPHQRHSDTSREAAIEKLSTAQIDRAKVYRYIKDRGVIGATDEEIQDGLGMDGNTERPRRRELQLAGLIEDSGSKMPTRKGRRAVVWVVVPTEPQGRLFDDTREGA